MADQDIDKIIDGIQDEPLATQGAPQRVLPIKQHPLDAAIDAIAAPELLQEKYGSGIEQAKTALEGGLSSATFGGSTGLENALFNNAEDIRGRREANPVAHAVGQGAGLVIPALLTEGLSAAGAMGKAGAGAAELAGLGGEGAGLVSRLGAHAVKQGVEGAIFQAGDEVSKMLSQDPNQSVQTAIADIGLSGLLGGALGVGLGGTGELWKATIGKRLGTSIEAASHAINEPIPEIGTPGTQLGELQDAMKSVAPNSPETLAAANRLGIELPTGSTSDRQIIRDLSQHTSERPTFHGQKLNKEYRDAYNGLEKTGQQALRDQTVKTESQVGKEIKEGLVKSFQDELKPVEQSFKKMEPVLKRVPVSDELKMDALRPIMDSEEFKFSKKSLQAVADEAEELSKVKNVNELKSYRTALNKRINAAFPNVGEMKEEGAALLRVKSVINDIKDKALQEGVVNGHISGDQVAEHYLADNSYAAIKAKLKQAGVEAGVGKINNVKALIDRLAKSSDESFATKLFDMNDINQMKYFQEHLPKEFDLARRYKLKEIAEKSANEAAGRGGKFDVGKFLAQVSDKKMNPEARELLFSGHSQKIQDMRQVYQSIPGVVNPSGTAKAMSLGKLFSFEGAVDNLSDAAKYALLKAAPHLEEAIMHAGGTEGAKRAALQLAMSSEKGADAGAFQSMAKMIGSTIRGENALSKAAKSVFDAGEVVLPPKLIPDHKDIEKLDKKLKDLMADNSPLFNVGEGVGHYMPAHGSNMAQVASTSVNYLNSLRPKAVKMSPLDAEPVVSRADKAHFDKALAIAQQPLLVFKDIKNGTITPQDMKTMRTIYPDLYNRSSQKLMSQMIESIHKEQHIPYKTRLGLSLFLGKPLDSTMLSGSIMAAQPHMPQPQQPMSQPKQKGSMKNLGKLAQASMTPLQSRQLASTKQ